MKPRYVIIMAFIILCLSAYGMYYSASHWIFASPKKSISTTTTIATTVSCPSCLNDAQVKALDIKAGHLQQQLDLLTIKYNALNKSVDVYRRMVKYMRNTSFEGIALANLTIELLTNVSWNRTDYKRFKQINNTAQAMKDKFLYISTR
jgi:hypothetical protein